MFCRNCGKEVHAQAIACPSCGVPPLLETKYCQNCGAATQINQAMCTTCGVALKSRSMSGSISGESGAKSKVAAGILGILLGSLGIHKFYLGYNTAGIIMLVVSIVGACIAIGPVVVGIIGLIEGIIYLMKTDEEFDRIYVQGKRPWF